MKHWIRDARYSYSGWNAAAMMYMIYHFLRVMGWEWLWECDGEVGPNGANPNHCDDGNMEEAGTAKWTPVGPGTVNKATAPINSGTQALRIGSNGGGSGGRSSAFLTMSVSTPYSIAIWASNSTGAAWDVQVDNGSGAFVSVGSIPDNAGVYTLYVFHFVTSGGVASRFVQIIDTIGTYSAIYIDGISTFRSHYEYAEGTSGVPQGTDGIVTNPDQFSTAGSYSFVVGDIGKFIAFYDPTNLGNTGVYAITAAAAGVATINLRSGTAALTNANSLAWRMFDMSFAPVDTLGTYISAQSAGFGLQSPHATKWRLFMRQYARAGQNNKFQAVWTAPEDTAFDVSAGNFWDSGPSVQNQRMDHWKPAADYTDIHCTRPPYTTAGTARVFAMVEDSGEWVSFYVQDDTDATHRPFFTLGYVGADADHPGIQEFLHGMQFGNIGGQLDSEFGWWKNAYDKFWMGSATVYDPDGQAVQASSNVEGNNGAGTSSSGMEMTQAGPSPWSGDEWLRRIPVVRDPHGISGCPSERELSIGIYQARANLAACTPFDSDNYFHIGAGTVWDWMGESL